MKKELTPKEQQELRKELNQARNDILKKWGFTDEQRAYAFRTVPNVVDVLYRWGR